MSENPENRERPESAENALQREVAELQEKSATAASLFDIRRIIGGLFVLYGLIVGITGLTDSDAAIDKAQGVNINLWTGLGMLVLGLLFLLWLFLRPTVPPTADELAQVVAESHEGPKSGE
ncbi:hypothetical protein ACIQU5_11005 [Streptomyces sp. NPDC090306]|uniref:hypothetical protein n=1 Tax=unclassified Streptomyces TaxID=2593676 RepID=UPI0036DFE5E1